MNDPISFQWLIGTCVALGVPIGSALIYMRVLIAEQQNRIRNLEEQNKQFRYDYKESTEKLNTKVDHLVEMINTLIIDITKTGIFNNNRRDYND